MYQFKLENEGFETEVAHTGPAGLHLIRSKRPNLVLLDLKLPHMNGDEILRHIRQNEWGQAIKVMITANIHRRHAPAQLDLLEFEKYLIKAHYTPSEIAKMIHEALEHPLIFERGLDLATI